MVAHRTIFACFVLVVLLNISFVYFGFSWMLWTHNYGSEGDQYATLIIQTSDGRFALAGRTFPSDEEYDNNDFWILQTMN